MQESVNSMKTKSANINDKTKAERQDEKNIVTSEKSPKFSIYSQKALIPTYARLNTRPAAHTYASHRMAAIASVL